MTKSRTLSQPVARTPSARHIPILNAPHEDVMPDTSYDAIVVGSGISGGWAAKELTEKGLRVLMLERGKNIEHIKDYVNAIKGPWEYAHRGGRTRAMEELYPVTIGSGGSSVWSRRSRGSPSSRKPTRLLIGVTM